MDPNTVALIGAGLTGGAAGALVTGLFTFLSQFFAKRAETKRFMLELCFRAATEYLHRDLESAKALSSKTGQRIPIGPIDLYLIHVVSLVKLLEDSSLSQEELIAAWSKIRERSQAIHEASVKESENGGL